MSNLVLSTPMVQAVRAGKKRMTRRLLDMSAAVGSPSTRYTQYIWPAKPRERAHWRVEGDQRELFGQGPLSYWPGQQLWVRETWAEQYECDHCDEPGAGVAFGWPEHERCPHCKIVTLYKADDEQAMLDAETWHGEPRHWKSPRFMPKTQARLFLDVTSVRVERLQDITEADILAEGVTCDVAARLSGIPWSSLPTLHHAWEAGWDSLNGRRAPWKTNPWVVVVGFDLVREAKPAPRPVDG